MSALEKANVELDAEAWKYWWQNEASILTDVPPELYEEVQQIRREIAEGVMPFPSAEDILEVYHDGRDALAVAHYTDPIFEPAF